MEPDNLTGQFNEEVRSNLYPVKAESLLALALENGLAADDFVVACDHFFYREYSKDILFSEVVEDASKKDFLQLHLTRRGLYDQLPEGLFYQQNKPAQPGIGAGEMAVEYKINKRKEQEVRRFFIPFENDLFWQRIQLEKEEMHLMEGFRTGAWNDFFTRLWDINVALPSVLMTHLLKLLPSAHSISGNPQVMAQCLSTILQEPVCVQVFSAPVSDAYPDSIHPLGNLQLGSDAVLGEQFYEDFPVVEFVIGPLENTPVADYLNGGCRDLFLSAFYRFFVPADAGVVTKIEVPKEKSALVLQQGNDPLLGYSSVI